VSGMKLKKIKVGLRNDKQITGRIYSLGASTARPLNKTLSSNFTMTGLSSPIKPFPVPWPNMIEQDLTSYNIDASNGFAVAFVYSGTTSNNIAVVEHTPAEYYNSLTYLNTPSSGNKGWYWLTNSETTSAVYIIRAYVTNDLTGIEDEIEILPSSFTLSQNYPNPFNPSTVISYQLPKQSRVQIKIYDAIGNEIRSLIDEEKSAGKYNILWDSRNNYGTRVSSGVYFYKITADGFAQTKKMILMK
ncbi:MAG: T9SS type A sorting domain-containing protein, partial [Ignavibacteria bacterium]|nr:T9SS type A sorting domain-containing protein [Ignavibacteria bacterium]